MNKTKIILAIIGAMWGLLALLAQNPRLREKLADLQTQLAASVEAAQLGENSIDAFDKIMGVHIGGNGEAVKPPPAYLVPVMSVGDAFAKAWAGGWTALLIAVAALLVALSVWYNTGTNSERSWAGLIIGVPIGTAVIAWLLKVVLLWLLAGMGVVVQLVATFAAGIMAIEYIRKTINEFIKYGDLAEKMKTKETPKSDRA